MNIATERFEKEILLEQPIIKNNHYQDTATIGAHLEKCTFMKELSSRIGKIDNLSPIFYFPTKDSFARKQAYDYIIPEMRESYKFASGYSCMFDQRILSGNYEYLHIYFRKNEILAVYCNDIERGKYFGVSMPRHFKTDNVEWEFKRKRKVECISMDLKLGIYDIRFELFFNAIFDFYINSGLKW